jgi:hypothetical protein
MSNFECSLKDLTPQANNTQANNTQSNNTQSNNTQSNNTQLNDTQIHTAIEDGPKNILSKNNQHIDNQIMNNIASNSLFDKIKEEKNIQIILLVIISYLITNSDQFIQLLGNTFPYLVDSGSTNLLGKTVVAVLIGLSVVIFTSFFQVP